MSNGQNFKLWIPPKNKFVIGQNQMTGPSADTPMENIRPQNIYEALLVRRIDPETEIAVLENGYETMHVQQKIPTPWYEVWPLDFFFENLYPFQIEDVRRFQYTMTPLQMPNPNALIDQGQNLRNIAQTIQAPPKPPAPAGPPPMSMKAAEEN